MLLTDKYADKIYGTTTCYDHVIIQGYIPGWNHAEGMTSYLNASNIRIFDFSNFSPPLMNRSVQTHNASQMKTTLRSSSSVSCGLSAKGSRKSSRKPERPKGWVTSFLPWNSVILISHGMTRPRGRHFLSLTRANVPTIISISLTKNLGSVTSLSLPGYLSGCSSI